MKINEDGLEFIRYVFPSLEFKTKNGINFLTGRLKFSTTFDDNTKIYTLHEFGKGCINGEFDIELNLSEKNIYRHVYEIGGEVKKIANILNKNLDYFHATEVSERKNVVNICVAGHIKEDLEIDIKDFLSAVVVPYFSDLIVIKNGGDEWQRGEYSHGAFGILEEYNEILNSENLYDITIRCIEELRLNSKNEKDRNMFNKLLNTGHVINMKDSDIKGIKISVIKGIIKLKTSMKKFNLHY